MTTTTTTLRLKQTCLFLLLCLVLVATSAQGITNTRCYGRLERALDDMLYKSAARSKSRSLIDLSGYRTHYDFNPEWFGRDGGGGDRGGGGGGGRGDADNTSGKGKSFDWNSETRASEVEDLLQQLKQQQQQQNNYYGHKYSNVIQPSRVEVSDIKFRVPRNAKWVNLQTFPSVKEPFH